MPGEVEMAAPGDPLVFWGLVALWMALAFAAWGLAFGGGGPSSPGSQRARARRLRASQAMGFAILMISVLFFLPFFLPLEAIPPSYIAATNASISLFVGLGIIMVARPSRHRDAPAPTAGGPAPESGDLESLEVVEVLDEADHDAPVSRATRSPVTPPRPKGKVQTITCPQCGRDFRQTVTSLPVSIRCPHCGVEGELGA